MDKTHLTYLDFELEIGPGEGRDYPVAVVDSPAGEAQGTMRFPYDELMLENRLLNLQNALLRSGGKRRQALSTEEQAVRDFGRDLFEALISGEVRNRYDVSLERAWQAGKGLRLELRIQSPELAALPWEYLYDPRQAEYVCLSRSTPVVRYLELPRRMRPLHVEPPLRILGMVASPSGLDSLDVTREKARVERALDRLQARGQVELAWLEGQTWRDLQRAMRGGPWHVFHFIGHGGFDPYGDEGFIVLADEAGERHDLSATQLGRLLADHRWLRLALLNTCEGARGSGRDIFSSTASILVRRGIPAVLAMQYEVTDRAAIEMARAFYEALADGVAVDAALAEARKAVSLAVTNTVEWGTPVLYTRSPDGLLFSIRQREREPQEVWDEVASEMREEEGARQAASPEPEPAAPAEPGAAGEPAASAEPAPPGEPAARAGPEPAARAEPEGEQLPVEKAERAAAEKPVVTPPEPERAVPKARGEPAGQGLTTQTPGPSRQRLPIPLALVGLLGLVICVGVIALLTGIWPPTPSPTPTPTLGVGSTTVREKDGMEVVYVPGGTFQMGSSDGEDDEQPVHAVTLDSFWMDRTEVTNSQYARCVADGACGPPSESSSVTRDSYYGDSQYGNYPVIYVDWNDAASYCEWAGGRLPSEAEWEYAACGPDSLTYPWGNKTPNDTLLNFNHTVGDTAQVGHYPDGASWAGAMDMAGNVFEWVNDWFGETYYASSPSHNPPGPGPGDLKVMRGAGWSNYGIYTRAANRGSYTPAGRYDNVGFRCVVDVGE